MKTAYEEHLAEAIETERRLRQESGKIVNVSSFGKVAKVLWPLKTAAFLASIAKNDPRTAERWLSGEHEPPGIVIAAIVVEITKRE